MWTVLMVSFLKQVHLLISIRLVAFELELDQDYAKWNMSRPSVNSLEYDNGLFTLIGVKRRYELSTTDGEFNILVAGLTQKK